jgi:tripartite-type tricarboxylate transporter receptor subunit TctC
MDILRNTLISCMFLYATQTAAQDYPSRPIRVISSVIGSSGDIVIRMIAPRISGPLGQQVIVDNRASATTAETLAKSPPDGYTLLIDATSLWIGPLLQDLPYDPVRDFAPISTSDRSPSVLTVNPSLPVKTVKDLIALAKARPGELNYGSAATGALSHLAAELFKSMAGVNIVRVSYKGGALAVNAVVAGEVPMVFNSAGSVRQHINTGRLRALAVASLQPSPLAPGLPTLAESGLPGFEAILIQGIFAPAKTPEAIVRKLNQEIVRALSSEELKERFLNTGIEAAGSTPEGFAATVKSEMAKWARIIKAAGIRRD